MPRQSFIIDLRFDGADQVEQGLKKVGETGDRSMGKLSNASQPARRSLLAVDDASKAVRDSAEEMADRLGPAGAALRALGPAGTAAAAGIAAASVGLVQGAQRAGEATRRFAELGEQADQLGVSVQALQELRFAASQVGVEESRLEDGLQELNSRLGELRNQAGPLNSALEDLGAEGLRQSLRGAEDTDQAFRILVDTLRDGDSTFDNAALAAAAFGEESGRAIQRLASQDLPALRQEFRDLGVAIDEDLVRQSQQARGELSELDTRIQNNVDVISTELTPALRGGKEAWADFTGAVRDAIEALKEAGGLDNFLAPSGLPGVSPFNITGLPGELFSGSDGGGSGGGNDLPGGADSRARLNEVLQFSQLVGVGQGSGGDINVPTPGRKPDAPSGGDINVPTPGRKPDAPSGGSGGGGGTSGSLSFAGVDFNDPFTLNDALNETIQLNKEVEQQIRQQAEAWAEAESQGRQVTDVSQELANTFADDLGRSFDRVGDELTRMFVRGEDAAASFQNVARGVASDLAQTFIELGITNPLKNAIFGTNSQTLEGFGGLISDIIPSFGGGATQTPGFSATSVSSGASGSFSFADGGSFTVNGAFPGINAGRDNRLVSFAARDGERVNVQTPEQQSAQRTEVNVYNQNGGEVETRRSRKGNGGERVDVLIKKPVAEGLARGEFDNEMQARFGLRPTKAGR